MTTQTARKTMNWNEITEPGTYVCNWSGHLVRIPKKAFDSGSPIIRFDATEPLTVTWISDNPKISVNEARETASSFGVTLNF